MKFQRLSNDPEMVSVFKALANFVKDRISSVGQKQFKVSGRRGQEQHFLEMIHRRATAFFALQIKIREEVRSAVLSWKTHFDLLSDIDELNQCKRAMRLQRDEDDVSKLTENELAFIVDPSKIAAELAVHEVKQATALGDLRRSKDTLRYLKNQRTERKALARRSEEDATKSAGIRDNCTVCLSAFTGDRAVLSCGHSYHQHCVERLMARSGGNLVRCPMRCAISTRRQDVFIATDKSKNDGSKGSRNIDGDYGTKVNRLVGDIMDTVDIGEKSVVFSQWEDMMSIVAAALTANKVDYIRPKSGKTFGDSIKHFRTSECPVLILNVKNGAEGLTLTEASHVFMLEPILNCGLDMQAINRIHRIGQTSKTYVHRYIVADTVEEKIDAIRMERQENHFEDDLQEQKKHSIKGGGIDGGFDMSELKQLFAGTSDNSSSYMYIGS